MNVAVVGAGPCGLTSMRWLLAHGHQVTAYERQSDVGGVWNWGDISGRVLKTTHMISSKGLTEFSDFRMPRSFPQYPHWSDAHRYLQTYATHFDLRRHIRFDAPVTRIEPVPHGYRVMTSDGGTQEFGAVVIANGHHQEAIYPAAARDFSGPSVHAMEVKDGETLRDQRVLIVGAGNSGCDLAVEGVHRGANVTLSMRRGYHFLPKFLCGAPLDRCGATLDRLRLPRSLNQWITRAFLRIATGPMERYGLPRPDHPLFATHPILNSWVPWYAAHGKLRIRPDVASFQDREACFVDGSRERFDLVVFATGYRPIFPFIEETLLNCREGIPDLFLHAFVPTRDDLFVVGMFQPNGAIWSLAELQAQIVSRYLWGRDQGSAGVSWFNARKARGGSRGDFQTTRQLPSPRHALEVDYFGFRRVLRRFRTALEWRIDPPADFLSGEGLPLPRVSPN